MILKFAYCFLTVLVLRSDIYIYTYMHYRGVCCTSKWTLILTKATQARILELQSQIGAMSGSVATPEHDRGLHIKILI